MNELMPGFDYRTLVLVELIEDAESNAIYRGTLVGASVAGLTLYGVTRQRWNGQWEPLQQTMFLPWIHVWSVSPAPVIPETEEDL